MSTQPSPRPLDDYVIVQPHRFQNLPLRTKSTLQPASHDDDDDSYPSSEDEYECVSSPDSIRSWNSTPPARSPSPSANVVGRIQGWESVTSFDEQQNSTTVTSPDVILKQKQSKAPRPVLKISTPSASHATQVYSFLPRPPAIQTPYVYTTPAEEDHPGTGLLRPAGNLKYNPYGAYARPETGCSYVSKAHSMQDPEQCGHAQIDRMILDRLIDHACEVRLESDMRTPASRDAILRYQMKNRLRELPSNHPVIRKAAIDSPFQYRSYQLRWTPAEWLKAYRDVLTDNEKLACWYLFLTHGKHFHTQCLFENFAESVRDLHLTAVLVVDARKVAQSVQSPSLTNANVEAILRDNELFYSTQLKVVANAEETRKIYDEVTGVSENIDSKSGSGDYHIHIPGTFQLPPPPSPPQQHDQRNSDIRSNMNLRRDAIKQILYESLADPMLPMPIKRKPLAVPPPITLPSGITMDHRALQDYQMQLMLLEQQNKKRYWCGGGLVPDHQAADGASDKPDIATNTSTSFQGRHASTGYQAGLKQVEEQDKQNRHFYICRQDLESPTSPTSSNRSNTPAPAPAPAPAPVSASALTDYEAQLKLLEQQCKKRHAMAAAEMDKEIEHRRHKLSRTGAPPLKLETRDYVSLSRK